MVNNILVVDDEANVRKLISAALEKERYKVIVCKDGFEALEAMETQKIDLVIVDVMMPKKNGWELTSELKEDYDIPILMLTARSEVEDKIKGFDLGCDDYLVKPFEVAELTVRVKALLRRYQGIAKDIIKIGNLELNQKNNCVKTNNDVIEFPVKEFQLLFLLANNIGKIFTRDELIENIWGINYDGDERTVDVHVLRIRSKLEKMDQDVKIITIRGLGYKLRLE
jgi:DNA-binding response OmpR family regulator